MRYTAGMHALTYAYYWARTTGSTAIWWPTWGPLKGRGPHCHREKQAEIEDAPNLRLKGFLSLEARVAVVLAVAVAVAGAVELEAKGAVEEPAKGADEPSARERWGVPADEGPVAGVKGCGRRCIGVVRFLSCMMHTMA